MYRACTGIQIALSGLVYVSIVPENAFVYVSIDTASGSLYTRMHMHGHHCDLRHRLLVQLRQRSQLCWAADSGSHAFSS